MQQRSEETRQQILRAAEQMFALHGFDGSGVAEICAAAGVSKGAFYHHFPSKHAVFNALLKEWLEHLDAGLALARQQGQTVPEILLHMSAMLQPVFQAASGQLHIFLEFWARASRDPQVWQATIAPYHRYQAYFTELIEEGIAQGSLRRVDPPSASRVIVALAAGILLQGLLDPQGVNWEQIAQQGISFLMRGIANEEETANKQEGL